MISALLARLRHPDPWRATLWLSLVLALLHGLVSGQAPLSADEAHYALYGLHPDWSYFDHPPLVGWMQALILPLSQSEWALRLWPVLIGLATALTLYRFARTLFPDAHPWLGFWTVALYQSGLLFQLLGLALVPETPLLLLSLWAMLFLLRALERGGLAPWLLFGLALGLAGLAKYTAVTLAITAVLFVVLQKRLDILRTPGPWLAVLLAAALITPVLYWNATHDWISFRYQFAHGYRPKDWDWSRAALSQAGQFFAYAPAIYLFGLIALVAAARAWRERGIQLTLLLVLPVLVLFASGSGREETLPHWTALAWAGLAPLTARWLIAHWSHRAVRATVFFSGGYSLCLIALLHLLLLFPQLPLPGKRHPLSPLAGWPEAATHALRLLDEQIAAGEPHSQLMVPNWSLASRLAWYARPQPVQVTDLRYDQFDLWFGRPRDGMNGIMVVPGYILRSSRTVLGHFDECVEQPPLPVVAGERIIVTFHFFLCRNYRPPVL